MANILAAPALKKIDVGGVTVTAVDLQTALNKARPGDVITLTAGTYSDPVTVVRGGSDEAPITIVGPADGSAIFDGGRKPEDGLYEEGWASDGHWAFVKMTGVAHVTFQHISFRNCWPAVFYLRGVSDTIFSDLQGTGSRHVVFARNSFFRKTRNLLLQNITWVQDPDHDMWEGRTHWKEVKQKKDFKDKSWFNGALFESYDIHGDVTIRHCDVSHAFNAVRMDIADNRVSMSGGKPTVSRNRNVRIYGNRFSFIRDNAIEPEGGLQGWLVAENHFFQVHAALSCDGVTVRDGAFVSNRFLNLSRPEDISNSGGKIIKFLDPADKMPSRSCFGFVTAFNSVRTRTRYVSDAKLKQWTDVNNAVERFAASAKDDEALFSRIKWNPLAKTDALATNDADYPATYKTDGANLGGWDPLSKVFKGKDPVQDINKSLGGWSGELIPTAATQALATNKVTLYGPDKNRATIPAGTGPGYRSLEDLGISAWLGNPVSV